MDLYNATWDYLAILPTVQMWPELNQLLQKIVGNKPPHWWMAARACMATGGTFTQAIPAVAALGAHFLNIVLIDDMLDADPKGQHNRLGYAITANLASALQAVGFEAIAHSSLSLESQAIVFNQLNRMLLKTTLGQHWDAQNPCDEESYWRVTRTKSSPYFGTSFFVGAFMSGSPEAIATQLGEVGELYGEMIQINDDLNDVLETPANADWVQGRYPLPILYATLVPHPDQARFVALRRHIAEEWALREAQEILIRCGAMSYGIDQLLQRFERVDTLLRQIPLADSSWIQELIEGIVAPVQRLLAQVNDSSSVTGTTSAVSVLHPH
jgi:geranylgeranyl pyrophosphate synthase